jgi:hypothetical protein
MARFASGFFWDFTGKIREAFYYESHLSIGGCPGPAATLSAK